RTRDEAFKAAETIGYPVTLKIVSRDIQHKVDVGGVRLNLTSRGEVETNYDQVLEMVRTRVPTARLDGVLIQEYLTGGKETIIGFRRDPRFGPLLMFGLGGIYVEAYHDVSFRLAPIRELGAQNMISQIRGSGILEGARGQGAVDRESLAECIERLSQLAVELEHVQELDVNPLVALEKGCRALDARIIIG